MNSVREQAHELWDVDEIKRHMLSEGRLSPRFHLYPGAASCAIRIIFFAKGTQLPDHFHDKGPIYKLVLAGHIRYDDDQEFLPGTLAILPPEKPYRAEAMEDTYMLLIEPGDARLVNV